MEGQEHGSVDYDVSTSELVGESSRPISHDGKLFDKKRTRKESESVSKDKKTKLLEEREGSIANNNYQSDITSHKDLSSNNQFEIPDSNSSRKEADSEAQASRSLRGVEQLEWEEEKSSEYESWMQQHEEKIKEVKSSVEERWNAVIEKIKEAAVSLQMIKKTTVKDNEKVDSKRNPIEEKPKSEERREEEEKWRNKINDSTNEKEFWESVRPFRGRKKGTKNNINKEVWQEHFEKLVAAESDLEQDTALEEEIEPSPSAEEMLNGDITYGEVCGVITKLPKKKAAGEDGIFGEFIKSLPEKWKAELADIINEIWKTGKMIQGWRTARIYPIHKGGDENDPSNYRGVSLLDIGFKILAKIMNERLKCWLETEGKLRESQAGFREGRSTIDHIFTLNSLIGNRLKQESGRLYIGFVDFKTAFDMVPRNIMFEKLAKIGVRGRMLKMIQEMYRETRIEIITQEGVTNSIETKKEIRQGCPLSPTLFSIFLDDIDDEWETREEGGTEIGGTKIYGLKFADDIALVADTPEGLQDLLRQLEEYSEKNRMEVNITKTKVLVCRNKGQRKAKNERWTFNGNELEIVKEFKYLGYWFDTRNSCTLHVKEKAREGKGKLKSTWGIMKRARIKTLEHRLRLFDTLVKTVCMYGVEIWGLRAFKEKSDPMEVVQNKIGRLALGISSNIPDYIWRTEAGRRSLEIEAKGRVVKYILDVLKMEKERWPRICLIEEVNSIINNAATSWGKDLCNRIGNRQLMNLIREGTEVEEISNILERKLEKDKEQEIQADKMEIRMKSRTWIVAEYYASWMPENPGSEYWEDKSTDAELKEEWARIRCGSVYKEGQRDYMDQLCRACKQETESLLHIWVCEDAKTLINQELVQNIEAWRRGRVGPDLMNWLTETLRGELNVAICKYARAFEDLARPTEATEQESSEIIDADVEFGNSNELDVQELLDSDDEF